MRNNNLSNILEFSRIFIVFLSFVLSGCHHNSNKTEDKNTTTTFVEDNHTNDTDFDGLADRYEELFGFEVGIADANDTQKDTLLEYQWYLNNKELTPHTTHNNLKFHEDINVIDAWRDTIGEKNITIAVVDTGIDINHPDLIVDTNKSLRYSDLSSDPSPNPKTKANAHGTHCAGIVAGSGWNSIGIRGVTPNINLVGLNVFSNPTDATFASALLKDGIDISSNSWGGGGAHVLYDDATSLESIESGVTNGRDGKGINYIFASGNDAANANFQSILTSGYVVAVSSVDGGGEFEEYSDFGSNILVSAPGGSDDANNYPAIVTTDISGLNYGVDTSNNHWNAQGNENGDYTHTMNGTSASAPMVSGVVGLMLSVNSSLNYKEVQYILAKTARKNDPNDSSWYKNGAGLYFSDKYGFGVVDATKAVELSSNFLNLGDDKNISKEFITTDKIISNEKLTLSIDIKENFLIQSAQIELDTDHNNAGKLKIMLESPSGTRSNLAYGDTVLYDDYNPWTFLSVQMLEEDSFGEWKLHITDMGLDNTSTYISAKLILKGFKR
jgi:subtilisin family serine protease